MKTLRLIAITPAWLWPKRSAVHKACDLASQNGRAQKKTVAGEWQALAKACFTLLALLFMSSAWPGASAQEKTNKDASVPLVYNVENTGAQYPTPTFPSFAQLPIVRPLPDPFLFVNGLRDPSFKAWEVRRNEIKAAIEKYELGPKPDCSDCTITANYVPPPTSALSTGTLTVVVTRNGKSLTMTSGVYIPQGTGPFAALIPMELGSFSFNGVTIPFPPPTPPDYGSLPPSVFQGLPVATVGFVLTQVAGYAFTSPSDHTQDPFYTLYPELCAGTCPSGTSNSGEYAAWSWGVSRLIDGMEIATHQSVNPLPIDMSHLAVTGCSYAGKMALIAGAFDERIALTIAQENGGGGAPAWRVSHEIEAQGAVEDIDDTNYDWWAGQMYQFAGANVYKLPEDHHELMAMVAPRALLQTGNTDFYWLSNRSNYITSKATQKVYNQFGIGDRFGFYIDGGHAHCATLPAEAAPVAAFVEKYMLGRTIVDTDVEVAPFPTLDAKRWTWWWGSENPGNDPQFPNDWVSGGNAVLSLDTGLGFLQSNAGQPVAAGYQLKMPGNHPAATVTLTGGNVEADIRCADASSYTLTIPFPANQSYSIGANKNAWIPAINTYQGVAPATACPSGVTAGVLQQAYFSALGVPNGTGNPPLSPGLTTTDPSDPLDVRFACSANGDSTGYSAPVNVNPQK